MFRLEREISKNWGHGHLTSINWALNWLLFSPTTSFVCIFHDQSAGELKLDKCTNEVSATRGRGCEES